MRVTLIGFLLVSYAVAAVGSVDLIAPWSEVSVRATAGEVPVVGHAKLEKGKLAELSLEVNGKRLTVPLAELEDLRDPQLHTFQVLYGHSSRSGPPQLGVHVKLRFGPLIKYGNQAEFGRATFHFSDVAYRERWTRVLVEPNKWQHYRKQIGSPAEPAGVEQAIGTVK